MSDLEPGFSPEPKKAFDTVSNLTPLENVAIGSTVSFPLGDKEIMLGDGGLDETKIETLKDEAPELLGVPIGVIKAEEKQREAVRQAVNEARSGQILLDRLPMIYGPDFLLKVMTGQVQSGLVLNKLFQTDPSVLRMYVREGDEFAVESPDLAPRFAELLEFKGAEPVSKDDLVIATALVYQTKE